MGSACSSDNSNKITHTPHTPPPSPLPTQPSINIDNQSIVTNEDDTSSIDEIQPSTHVVTHVVVEDSPTEANEIIKWKAIIPIHRYHWWPMKDTDSYSLYNNLYADNGGLDKYDTLMNTKAKEYQKSNHYRAKDSTALDANWAGFCDKATTLSCLYEYPKHPVKVNYKNKEIDFSVFNIEALMIIASDNSINRHRGLFMGERNNSNHPTKNNKSEPLPSELLEMLESLSHCNTSFAMDIDSGPAVWNYSFDSFSVKSYSSCPIPHEKPKDGTTQYLHFIIDSTAYPDKAQHLWGYINKSKDTYKTTEEWITDNHPDFIWKHYPKKSAWKGKCNINPNVNAGDVYKIYQQSLTDGNDILYL
jgi:hypothetical protein